MGLISVLKAVKREAKRRAASEAYCPDCSATIPCTEHAEQRTHSVEELASNIVHGDSDERDGAHSVDERTGESNGDAALHQLHAQCVARCERCSHGDPCDRHAHWRDVITRGDRR